MANDASSSSSSPSLPTETVPYFGAAKDFYRHAYLQNAKIIGLLQGLQQLPDLMRELITNINQQPSSNATVQALSDLHADNDAASEDNLPPSTTDAAPAPSDTAAQTWFFQNNLQTTVKNIRSNDKLWNRNIKIYRDAVYEQRRNVELAHLYDEWSTENVPYFEKRFAPKILSSDSEEIREIKQNQAAVSLQHEISLMQQRAREKEEKTKEVDEEMKENIKNKNDQLVANLLLEKWEKEKEEAKKKAIDGWQKKRESKEMHGQDSN